MPINVIVWVIIIAGIVDVILFLILLYNKIASKYRTKKLLSDQGYFREEIGKYIRGDNSPDFVKTVQKSSMEALERVCFDYLQFVRGETRDKILEILKAAGTGKKYGRKLERGLWWSQALAAYKLGMLRSVEWVPVLLKRLNSKNPDVCYNSAKALLRIEGVKYLEEIISVLGHCEKISIGRILDLFNDVDEDVYPVLTGLIGNGVKKTTQVALEAFGARKDLRSVPVIGTYLWDKDDEIKLSALKAAEMIGGIADSAYFQRLLLLYKHKDWKIRQKVAEILGKFQNDTGIETLGALLKDKNINVGISAGNSLLKLGQNGQRALEQTYNGSDEAARAVAAFVLQRHGMVPY